MTDRSDSDGRLSHQRAAAPKAPPKTLKYDPIDMEVRGNEAPGSFGDNHRKALVKSSRESSEPQALVLRHLEERVDPEKGVVTVPIKSYHDEEKVSLARAGETILETFYGMFYVCDDETKEWKLSVDGFIPLCFIQERGNANKPFKIIAVSGTLRLMEFSVTKDTKCAQNKAFVKWNEGLSNMYGVRFAKEGQANQFYSALCRMKSTLIKTAELFKQPERKAMVSQISDPKTASVPHSKTSLIVKLPNKETTVMSVPGLLTMSELFDLICKKESLNPQEHQLSLPRIGNKELTYKSDTVLGSLKIREVSIIYVGVVSDNGDTSGREISTKVESLLEDEHEKGKQLDITLPSGHQKSLLVPLNMPVRNLETYICKQENLNPRHYSLQSIDFKHQCFDANCAVGEIEFSELRLMDKRGHSSQIRGKLTKAISSDDSCVGISSKTNISVGLRTNRLYSSQESLDVEGRKATRNDSRASSNSEELASISETGSPSKDTDGSRPSIKPPVPPQPYNPRLHPSRSNEKLSTNDLKSSHSFSEFGEKRTNVSGVREPSLRDSGKTKRKAPRPPRPPQPSPRLTKKETDLPSSHPVDEKPAVVSESNASVGSPKVSPHQRHAKKRQAPARPPAPKPSSRQRTNSNITDESRDAANKNLSRPPPIFCPPPPPDGLPPPLDECEHPVSPLSDEELQDTTWSSGIDSPEVNGYPEETRTSYTEQHAFSLKKEITQQPVAVAHREKPKRPDKPVKNEPEKPVPATRQSSLPPTPTSPDRPFMSPEPIPLKFLLPTPEKRTETSTAELQEEEQDDELSRINFDGDSRSSSIDIMSFPESEMFMMSPIEGYKPFPVEPPMEFAEDESLETATVPKPVEPTPEEPTLPPPLGFSKAESIELTPNLSTSNDSGNVECSGTESDVTIEDMVVPPPPVLSEEEISQTGNEEKPDSQSQVDVMNSIPPPMDFASPPEEFANPPAEFADDGSQSPQHPKKKLGLNASSFPWLAEPQPLFNAEIKDINPEFKEETKESPIVTTSMTDVNKNEGKSVIATSISDEIRRESSDLSLQTDKTEMKFESLPVKTPEALTQDIQQNLALESESMKASETEYEKGFSLKQEVENQDTYKTPFDDMEDVTHSTEDPDEGFDDLPDPILEPSKDKELDSKDTDNVIKGMSQPKADYKLDLSDTPELSPPTPPLTSPPGSGYVSPTLPSPLCSPREEVHQEPTVPVEAVPAEAESVEIQKNAVPSIDSKSNESQNYSSSSSDRLYSTEQIELPNPPPITVPPLRRYSDLAADISFATPGLKLEPNEPSPKEDNKKKVNSSNKIEEPQIEPQVSSGYKRPIKGTSAFKTQSWADIKNREKEMEEERKKKNEQSSGREPPPPSLVFRNLNRSSATAIRPKSWVAPSSKSFNPILPSVYKAPGSSTQSKNTTDTKIGSSVSGGSEQAKSPSPPPNTSEPKTSSSSIAEESKSSKREAIESVKHRPVVIIPSTTSYDQSKPSSPSSHATEPKPSSTPTDAKSKSSKTESVKDRPVVIIPSTTSYNQSKPSSPSSHTTEPKPSSAPTDVKSKSSKTEAVESVKDRPVVIIPSTTSYDQSKPSSPSSHTTEPKPFSAPTGEKSKSSKTQDVASIQHKPVVVIPSSSTTETTPKVDNVNSNSSQNATNVVMRKKTDKKDLGEKRKSVQDMMSMFGTSKDTRRNSDDSTPQQSPAMRSLEEKINKPNKQHGILTLANTSSTKPDVKESRAESKKESKTEDSLAKPAADTKAKGDGMNARVYKIIMANDDEAKKSSTAARKEETKKEVKEERNDPKPKSSSINPRQKYNILFPAKNEIPSNSTESTTSSQEKKEIKSSSSSSSHHTAKDNTSVGAKRDQEKSTDVGVPLREKEPSKPVDPFKRRSMPVYVLEKNDTRPQPEGGNLKILMAPQISDVDVVPRGRVAAMKAAWKKEGN